MDDVSGSRWGGKALPLAFAFLRIPLIVVAAALTVAVFAALGNPIPFPASSYSALYLLPVNIVTLLLLRAVLHRQGRRIRDVVGFDRSRLGRDILWGLLWLMVLYLPFALAVLGTMFALFGAETFTSFEAVFVPPPETTPLLPFGVSLALAITIVVTFTPLNAPTEELVYRGFAQEGLARPSGSGRPARKRDVVLAIVIPAIGFGIQHVFFAPTLPGMVVFAVAFFVWGVVGGIIFAKQRRLLPLIVAHLLVNLFTSAPALLVPFLAR